MAVLDLLSSEQKAQAILQPDSGVLGNDSGVFTEVFSRVIPSLDLNQLANFFIAFNKTAIEVRTF